MKKTTLLLMAIMATPAFAQEMGGSYNLGYAAAIAVAIAALGGTLAQGKIVSSAMEGIARNPQANKDMFVPMILGLAFVESLVIFAWVMANFLQGKI